MKAAGIALLVALSFGSTDALGEGEPMSHRGAHWGIGFGGSAMITGSASSGSLTNAELYPGGRFGRLGFRLEARGIGRTLANTILGGVTFEAAVARPRLQLALYAAVGGTVDGLPAASAGLQTQLWLVGPLALGLDTGGVLVIDGTADTELLLGSSLTIRLAR